MTPVMRRRTSPVADLLDWLETANPGNAVARLSPWRFGCRSTVPRRSRDASPSSDRKPEERSCSPL